MSKLENIERLKKSRGMQLRKVIQMNSMTKYLASRFSDRCATAIEEFFKLLHNKLCFWETTSK